MVAPCPRCGHEWDLTGGGSGTWTLSGNRLEKVAEYVTTKSPDEIRELAERVARIDAANDVAAAVELLTTAGWKPRKGKSKIQAARQAAEDIKLFSDALQSIVKSGAYTAGAIYLAFKGLR